MKQLLSRAVLAIGLGLAIPGFAQQILPIAVWKDATCGCCKDWVTHLEKNGFKVTVHDSGNRAKREEVGMPMGYAACHTAIVNGYVIEGHVPASDIRKRIKQKPAALGLAVPGMPLGSPGMEYGNQKQAYSVLLVAKNGQSQVFTRYQ